VSNTVPATAVTRKILRVWKLKYLFSREKQREENQKIANLRMRQTEPVKYIGMSTLPAECSHLNFTE
jgi:hypothetical protein